MRGGKKHPQHRIYPYLLRKLAITRPNQVWCSDITYIPVKNGFLYLVAIMDWATRKVLTWRLSNTLDASFCVEALEEAIARYGKPAIMNTDEACVIGLTMLMGQVLDIVVVDFCNFWRTRWITMLD